jgi:hypothetical protein
MLEIDVEMNVFEKEFVLEKKLHVEMNVFEKKLVLEMKLEMDLLEKKTCDLQLQHTLQELGTEMAWPQ